MSAAAVITIPDDATLDDCETVIEENLLAFVKTGLALQAIRERKLYKGVIVDQVKVETWTEYLRLRWDVSRAHAGRLVNASEAYTLLAEVFNDDDLPPNERVFRPFVSGMAKADEIAKIAIWEIISQTAPGKVVTDKHVELVVGVMKEVVITRAVEDGDGGQIHVSQALKAQITAEVYETYQRQKRYNDATTSKTIYQGRGVILDVDNSQVTIQLECELEQSLEGGVFRLFVTEI